MFQICECCSNDQLTLPVSNDRLKTSHSLVQGARFKSCVLLFVTVFSLLGPCFSSVGLVLCYMGRVRHQLHLSLEHSCKNLSNLISQEEGYELAWCPLHSATT